MPVRGDFFYAVHKNFSLPCLDGRREKLTGCDKMKKKGREGKEMDERIKPTAHYHLPGLFEFYEFYRVFLPLFYEHREWFYDWCDIGSIYGAPAD